MPNHSKILYVLHIVLVEIRATENIKKSRMLADVVHNVPMMVSNGRGEGDIVAEVILKAKRQGIEGYFAELFGMAKGR